MRHLFLSVAWRIYAMWSNFYSSLEESLFLDNDGFLRKYEDQEYVSLSRKDAWRFYTKEFLMLFHYGRDRWYMGFDVMSSPVRFVNRKEGDCDDFARLGRYFFGERFCLSDKLKQNEAQYVFEGFYCMKFETGGHCIAVWKCLSCCFPKYFVVENDEVLTFTEDEDFIRIHEKLFGKIEAIGVLSFDERKDKLSYSRTYTVAGSRLRRES